jgi:cell division protein FtsL
MTQNGHSQHFLGSSYNENEVEKDLCHDKTPFFVRKIKSFTIGKTERMFITIIIRTVLRMIARMKANMIARMIASMICRMSKRMDLQE